MLAKYRIINISLFKNSLINYNRFTASFDCDGCKKKIEQPECNACHRMINYFKVFDMSPNYQVNRGKIAQKAKQLQKQFHPDKNINSTKQEKFQDYSSYINSAKNTLLDDLKRAQYLLQLKGINVEQEKVIQDAGFMVQMFELQEQIQQANQLEAVDIKKRIEGILSGLKVQLSTKFEAEDIQKCKQFVHKYKYLCRALENVNKRIAKREAN